MEKLREEGCQRFILDVDSSNEPAIKAYSRAGFVHSSSGVTVQIRPKLVTSERYRLQKAPPSEERLAFAGRECTELKGLSLAVPVRPFVECVLAAMGVSLDIRTLSDGKAGTGLIGCRKSRGEAQYIVHLAKIWDERLLMEALRRVAEDSRLTPTLRRTAIINVEPDRVDEALNIIARSGFPLERVFLRMTATTER